MSSSRYRSGARLAGQGRGLREVPRRLRKGCDRAGGSCRPHQLVRRQVVLAGQPEMPGDLRCVPRRAEPDGAAARCPLTQPRGQRLVQSRAHGVWQVPVDGIAQQVVPEAGPLSARAQQAGAERLAAASAGLARSGMDATSARSRSRPATAASSVNTLAAGLRREIAWRAAPASPAAGSTSCAADRAVSTASSGFPAASLTMSSRRPAGTSAADLTSSASAAQAAARGRTRRRACRERAARQARRPVRAGAAAAVWSAPAAPAAG